MAIGDGEGLLAADVVPSQSTPLVGSRSIATTAVALREAEALDPLIGNADKALRQMRKVHNRCGEMWRQPL